MLMTDMAVRDLVERRVGFVASIRRAIISLLGRESDHNLPTGAPRRQPHGLRSTQTPFRRPQPALRVVQHQPNPQPHRSADARWARHPQLRSRQATADTIQGDREARILAERGLILARSGKFAEALEAFTAAARDPEVDLSALPGFWDLPRQGMQAAVRGYERTNRLRDAAALEARIRHMLKPRAMRPVPQRQSRVSASGD